MASVTPKFKSRLFRTRGRSATYVPDPRTRRRRPSLSRERRASRSVARDTPIWAASSGSGGRRVPPGSRPSSMRCVNSSRTEVERGAEPAPPPLRLIGSKYLSDKFPSSTARFNGVTAYSRPNGLSARCGLVRVSEGWSVGLHAARMGGPDRLHGMGGERPPQVVGSPCSPGIGTAMLLGCRPLRRPRRVGPGGISLICPGAVRPSLQVAVNLSRGGLGLGAPPP
jgi:hypothetical protein